jgi:hypothetical protein
MANSRARFVIVAFTWRGEMKVDELRPSFDAALDWVKLGGTTWVLWTTKAPSEWQRILQPFIGDEDTVLIAELNLAETLENYSGWQYKWVWDWIDKHRF